ncbi:MAG: DUF4302 domain-containing protein [Bacteroidales bacterium]|nr:DUF4302 domain-containing protein [Bacteroidales bacterium]
MKTNLRTTLGIAAAIFSLTFVSCQNESLDYFGQTASSRIQESLESARKVLLEAENGWAMEYFTASGGYNYAIRFIGTDTQGNPIDSLVAASELSYREPVGSYFRLTTDDGPILSFDTYNEVLHYFATPDSDNYQAYGGDFEFIILSATEDEVVLKGKRTGYISRMTPIRSGDILSVSQEAGLNSDKFVVLSASGFVNGERALVEFDLAMRNIIISGYQDDGQVDKANQIIEPFIITGDGVKFVDEIEAFGARFNSITVNQARTKLLISGVESSLNIDPVPSGYTLFKDFPGNYIFTYQTGEGKTVSRNVTLSISDQMNKYIMLSGFSNDYGIEFSYSYTDGCLHFFPQYVGELSSTDLVAVFTSDGNVVSNAAGIDLISDGNGGYRFKDNPNDRFYASYMVLFRDYEAEDGMWYYDQFFGWSPSLFIPKTLTRVR